MSITFYPNYIMGAGFDPTAEPSISGQIATMSNGEASDDPAPLYDILDNSNKRSLSIDTSGEGTAAVIQVETTSSITCNFAIIDNHNLKSSDANYDIYYNSGGYGSAGITSGYSGTLGSALVADAPGGGTEYDAGYDGITLVNITSRSSTGWQLIIDDVDVFDADVTLAEFILGTSFTPTTAPDLMPLFGSDYDGVRINEASGGARYGYSNHDNRRRAWQLHWKFLVDADKTSFETLRAMTIGDKYPFYIDLGEAATPQLYRVRFVGSNFNFKGVTSNAWDLTITIEEEI